MKIEGQRKNKGLIQLIALAISLTFLMGYFFPDYWWSSHFIKFVSPVWQFSTLLMFLVIFTLSFIKLSPIKLKNQGVIYFRKGWPIILFLISFLLFYHFPMVEDFYGEAYILQNFLLDIPGEIPPGTNESFFKFGLAPWDGQKTIFALITYISYFLEITYRDAFILFDAIFGSLFVLLYCLFVNARIKRLGLKIILVLALFTAPYTLNYYGHIEINAIVFFIHLAWMISAIHYLENLNLRNGILSFLLLIIALKIHALSLLFLPLWLALFYSHLNKNEQKVAAVFNWKIISRFILLPLFILGLILYFFVFEDYKDPRSLLNKVTEYERLFLPLLSPEPPLDRYNLFSFNHIFDYFSEVLLWSPVLIFLLLTALLCFRKEINFQKPNLVLMGSISLLFVCFFFPLNPVLSMQMDWDLFCMPATSLFVFSIILLEQLEKTRFIDNTIILSFATATLCFPTFLVHQNRSYLSYRLESTGIRIFKTYNEWSALVIHNALGLLWQDRALQIQRKERILEKLQPYANPGYDRNYAGLYTYEAKHLLRVEKNFNKAIQYAKMAKKYFPNDPLNDLYLMEAYFSLNEPKLAYEYSLNLLEYAYPDINKALLASIQCALEAGLYQNALGHCNQYMELFPEDEFISKLSQRLYQNDRVEELKFLFQQEFSPQAN